MWVAAGGTAPTEHVATVEAGAGVTPGSTDGTAYNHYGLEAGLYRHLGLGTAPNNGAAATPLPLGSDLAPSPSPTPTSPTPTTTSCSGGISVDPSSPAVVHSKYGVSSASTASFSPPAGSLLIVIVNALQAAPGGETVTVSDSHGATFTPGPHIEATKAANSSWFAQHFEASAPGALTITARQAGSNLGTVQLAVQVLDGAAASQAGAAAGTYDGVAGTAAQTHVLSNTEVESWLYVAVGNGDSGAALTPVAGQADVDVWNDP